LLPVYTRLFFQSIDDNDDCVILRKDIDLERFRSETEKMIFLARAAGTKIFLKIDPRLLSLLSSDNYKEYFSNNENKSVSFGALYQFVRNAINTSNDFNVLSNNVGFLRNKNKNKNNIVRRYKSTNNAELKDKLRREIRFRRILIELGFKDWPQFYNMSEFFKNIIKRNKLHFSFKLDFDLENFLSRFTICRGNGYECFEDIPLSRFGKLSSDKRSFIFTETNKNTDVFYREYEYLRPFLDYIIGPSSTDIRRAMCMAYAAGTAYYPGSFRLILQTSALEAPFICHACFQAVFFLKILKAEQIHLKQRKNILNSRLNKR
jgi:hypothetical protein